jgi:hypothetical protein
MLLPLAAELPIGTVSPLVRATGRFVAAETAAVRLDEISGAGLATGPVGFVVASAGGGAGFATDAT